MDQQWNNDNNNNTYKDSNVSYDNSNVTYASDIMYDNTVTDDASATQSNDSKDGMCIASMILGIVGFFVNPVYVVSILAIIFGAIGMKSTGTNAGKAKVGLVLGIVAICIQIVLDFILTIFTAGMGGISFCC